MHSRSAPQWAGSPTCSKLKLCFQRACGCRAEVLIQCDGGIGDNYYLSSGYLKTFGSGCAQCRAHCRPCM